MQVKQTLADNLVDEPVKVLKKSYTVWVTLANVLLYAADHMEWLDAIPQQYRTTIQLVLLALIPIVRILRQPSLSGPPVIVVKENPNV